jgi:prevent-host-death family protein
MKTPSSGIGVRALRANLSAHLRTVAQGHVVTISDRRRQPVARLVPIEQNPDAEVIDRLVARGILSRGTGKPSGQPPVKPKRKGRLVSDIVREDRR